MKSWRTTTLGIAAIVAALAGVATAIANGQPIDWPTVSAAICAGAANIFARDNTVTSEQAGAK